MMVCLLTIRNRFSTAQLTFSGRIHLKFRGRSKLKYPDWLSGFCSCRSLPDPAGSRLDYSTNRNLDGIELVSLSVRVSSVKSIQHVLWQTDIWTHISNPQFYWVPKKIVVIFSPDWDESRGWCWNLFSSPFNFSATAQSGSSISGFTQTFCEETTH